MRVSLKALLRREVLLFVRTAGFFSLLPVVFFLASSAVFAFVLKGQGMELAKTAPALLSVLMGFAILLSHQTLFVQDHEEAVSEYMLTFGQSLLFFASVKMLCHWLFYGLPLSLLAVPVAYVFDLPAEFLPRLFLVMVLGSGIFVHFGALVSVLVLGLGASALAVVVMALPFYWPGLIFMVSALSSDGASTSALYFLGALSLFSFAVSPLAAGWAFLLALER